MTPTLPLPPSNEAKLYRAIIKKLQDDPTLKRVVKTWNTFTGDRTDVMEPSERQYPWVEVAPVADRAAIEAIGLQSSPLTLQINLVVSGTNMDDLLNLWAAIMRALFPGDRSMLTICDNCNAKPLKLLRSAYGAGRDKKDQQCLVSLGIVGADVLLSTSL